MVRNLKYGSIAICVVLCVTALIPGPAQTPVQAQRRSTETENDQAQAATVLLEAFVVEVNLPALAELGVSPIGRPPHSVSVENILTCLENDQARVVGGAKEAVQDQRESQVEATRTTYIKRSVPPQPRVPSNYAPYNAGTKLSARATLSSERSVQISYSFSSSVFILRSEAEDIPPDMESWEWGGYVLLRLGEPTIAAATQDRQRTVFLLLTAHVQNQ
jgi:hypothetical protein